MFWRLFKELREGHRWQYGALIQALELSGDICFLSQNNLLDMSAPGSSVMGVDN